MWSFALHHPNSQSTQESYGILCLTLTGRQVKQVDDSALVPVMMGGDGNINGLMNLTAGGGA